MNFIMTDYILMNSDSLVINGSVAVMDMSAMKLGHATQFVPSFMKKMSVCSEVKNKNFKSQRYNNIYTKFVHRRDILLGQKECTLLTPILSWRLCSRYSSLSTRTKSIAGCADIFLCCKVLWIFSHLDVRSWKRYWGNVWKGAKAAATNRVRRRSWSIVRPDRCALILILIQLINAVFFVCSRLPEEGARIQWLYPRGWKVWRGRKKATWKGQNATGPFWNGRLVPPVKCWLVILLTKS